LNSCNAEGAQHPDWQSVENLAASANVFIVMHITINFMSGKKHRFHRQQPATDLNAEQFVIKVLASRADSYPTMLFQESDIF